MCSAGEKIHDNKAAVVGYPHVSVIIKKTVAALLLQHFCCLLHGVLIECRNSATSPCYCYCGGGI